MDRRVAAALRDFPGDALLRDLVWQPLARAPFEGLWGYYTSRPRRYELEPRLVEADACRWACRCGPEEECDDPGKLELHCLLASALDEGDRISCWLPAEDVALNPQHAAVLAGYDLPVEPPVRTKDEETGRYPPRRALPLLPLLPLRRAAERRARRSRPR